MSTKMQDLMARARDELRHEPIDRRVRAWVGPDTVVDSTRALLVWEPRRVCPTYAVPEDDIRAELASAPATIGDVAGVLHPRIPFGVHTAAGEPLRIGDRVGAGFRLADDDLAGYVALDFDAFDDWREEDERVVGHPRDPYHRVEVLPSSRAVRIELDGELLAESTSARLLYETSLPTRIYLPREDVRLELQPSPASSYCPYKGHASWWSVDAAGRRHEDIGWSYEEPLPPVVAITGLVAFWNERVDVAIEGERRERPGGLLSEALLDEFGA
jgi:uncharacterized protein (DUF427 family)